MNTATKCTYVRDKTQAYPAEIAATTGFAVSNYALGGTETTVTAPSGRPPIIDQVASVDPLTTIVIFEGGTNDTAFGSTDYTRIDEVTAAIRARAPKAKIVFVGVRYYWSSQADKVDAWDAHERSVAASVGGAFVDTRIWPPSDYADFPDGTHPSVTGVHKLATAVVEALKALQLPSYGASDQR
jgi:lysophospholipase L1-like esterase